MGLLPISVTMANSGETRADNAFLPSVYNYLFDETDSTDRNLILNQLKAFPTAYGAGAASSGGRNGVICYVNTLEDPESVNPNNDLLAGTGVVQQISSGVHIGNYIGSLRGCLRLEMPRTVYFLVGGRFEIDRLISLSGSRHDDITIAGETALQLGGLHVAGEYDGITVNPSVREGNRSRVKDIFVNNVDNIVIRYLDRKGLWEYWRDWGDGTDTVSTVSGRFSPLNLNGVSNVVIDHFSGGWGSYALTMGGVNSNTGYGGKITVQSSLMHESIGTDVSETVEGHVYTSTRRGHNVANLFGFQTPRDEDGELSLDLWGLYQDMSVHDTAYIGLTHRFPNISGYINSKFYVANNYIDNWGSRASYVGGSPQIDLTNNFYRKLSGPVYTASNDPGNNRTVLTLHPDSHNISGNVQSPSIYTRGNIIEAQDGGVFDNDIAGDRNWINMSGYWSNSNVQHLPLSNYQRLSPLASTPYPYPLKSAYEARETILSNGVGASARIYPDGSTFVDSPIDRHYFDWARNDSAPTTGAVTHGDGGLGDSARFVHPYYPSRTISLDSLDADGVPFDWELPKGVINNAGYPRLDLYLADLAGDYVKLGLTQPQINIENATTANTEGEVASVGAWTRNSAQLSVVEDLNYVFTGSSALKFDSNSGGYSSAVYQFSSEPGRQYQVSFWAARSNGTTQGVYNWSGVESFVTQRFDPATPYINGTNNDQGVWQEFSQIVKASNTTVTLRFYVTNPEQGSVSAANDLYLDNVSITPH